jgi:hypothetical protein
VVGRSRHSAQKPSTPLELATAPISVASVTPYSQRVFLMGGSFRIHKQIRTRRFALRPYLSMRWVRRHPRMRRFGVVRPPLPIWAIDTVVAWQYAILIHSLSGAATTCRMFGLGGLRRLRRRLGRQGLFWRYGLFRRGRVSLRLSRRCVVALPNCTEDNRRNHHQDYEIADVDADARPRRLRRSVAGEIWTSVARWLGRSGN